MSEKKNYIIIIIINYPFLIILFGQSNYLFRAKRGLYSGSAEIVWLPWLFHASTLKPRPSWWTSMLVFFQRQRTSNMDFYLLELSLGLHGYSIAELDSHVEVFHTCLLKLRPSSWTSMLVFFQRQRTSNMDFYLLELSLGLHGYSIAELNSPVELFFATSKIITLSWLEAAGSFAGISDIKSRGLPTS